MKLNTKPEKNKMWPSKFRLLGIVNRFPTAFIKSLFLFRTVNFPDNIFPIPFFLSLHWTDWKIAFIFLIFVF